MNPYRAWKSFQQGASSLYGSEALGGVIQFLTRPAAPAGLSLEASYGNQNTPNLSLSAGGQLGQWRSTFAGELFHTDGYVLVPEASRGSVDIKAGLEHRTRGSHGRPQNREKR